ncbi:MAG TPA: transcriptional regulator, partial [Acidimicrobiia bacterium]
MTVTVAAPRAAFLVATAGCAALTARPLLLAAGGHPVAVLTALFAVLLAVSVAWPAAPAAATPLPAAGTAPPVSAVIPPAGVLAL